MKKMPVLMTLCLLIAAVQNVCAQPATDKKQQYASVGDFLMENGQKIIDCKVGYRTLGKLNEKGSNAILYPTPSIDPWQRKKLFDNAVVLAAFTLTESIVTTPGVIIACFKRAGEVKTGTIGN